MGITVTSYSNISIVIDFLVASKLLGNTRLEIMDMIKKDFKNYKIYIGYSYDTVCSKCNESLEYADKCELVGCERKYCDDCSICTGDHYGPYKCNRCGGDTDENCVNQKCEKGWCEDCEICKDGHCKSDNSKVKQKKIKLPKIEVPGEILIKLSEYDNSDYKSINDEVKNVFDIDLELLVLAKKKYGAKFKHYGMLHISS